MAELKITPLNREVVEPAIKKSIQASSPAVSVRLSSGKIITGRNTGIMTARSKCGAKFN